MFHLLPRVALVSVFLITAFAAEFSLAQQIDELSQLQSQLQQIQNRINNLQQTDEDPFGSRVRAVGRQRKASPQPIEIDHTLVIRFYDLSDIFSVAPQYPARISNDLIAQPPLVFGEAMGEVGQGKYSGGGFGGGGGGVFNIPPSMSKQQQAQTLSLSAARVSVGSLINAIQSAVQPDEWVTTNGEASINVLANTLLISATDSMHEQISNLLDLIREHWGKLKTVSIDAYWIRADSNEVQGLLSSNEENRVVGKIDMKKWQAFFDKAFAEKRISYSANITGHNGQTLHALAGRQELMVVDIEALYSVTGNRDDVENEDEEFLVKSIAGMKPVRNSFHEGAVIQVSPFTTRGGNFVILDLHTRVNELIDLSGENGDPADRPKALVRDANGFEISHALDNAKYRSYRLSTTVRCPKNEVLLVGGMTYDINSGDDQPNMYLFVQARIHTIEEDQSDRKVD